MPNGVPTRIDLSRRLIWEFGRPAEVWLSYRQLISKLIAQHKLKALPPEAYPYLPMAGEPGVAAFTTAPASGKKASGLRWPIPFPGGMRIPHLHFNEDIYLVEPKQWKEFSHAVVKDIQQRLANAAETSFDEILQLGQSTASLGR